MEFKYRAVDNRPQIPTSSSRSSSPPFSNNALQVCSPITDSQREVEKQKIREEILMGGLVQRRALEAEVLRELQMEGFQPPLALLFPPPYILYQPPPMQLESNKDFELPGLGKTRSLEGSTTALESGKEKLIVLKKPDPGLFRTKRKSATVAVDGDLPFAGTKKPKEEWSCALCHVSATTESDLKSHLEGRKHRAKEAALRAENAAKSLSATQVQQKNAGLSSGLEKAEADWMAPKIIEMDNGGEKKMEVEEHEESKTNELLLQNERQLMKPRKNGATTQDRGTPEFPKKKKFRFWCQMCQTGAYTKNVWKSHTMGKKHTSLLQEHGQNGETASNGVIHGSSVGCDMTKDSTAVPKEENTGAIERTIENIEEADAAELGNTCS